MRAVRGLALAAAICALVSGCQMGTAPSAEPTPSTSASTPSVAAPSSATPSSSAFTTYTPPVPEVGNCWDARISISVTVPCDGEHDSETYFVERYDDPATRPSMSDATEKGRATCIRELAAFLGSPDWLATRFWFSVEVDPHRSGSTVAWMRCDATAAAPHRGADIQVFTASVHGALATREGFDTYRQCWSDDNEDELTCDEPHIYQAATPVVDLTDVLGSETPDEEDYFAAMRSRCPDIVADYVGAVRSDVGTTQSPLYGFWRSGLRSGVCFAATDEPITGVIAGIGYGDLPFAS